MFALAMVLAVAPVVYRYAGHPIAHAVRHAVKHLKG
jgi:hypothetical protein